MSSLPPAHRPLVRRVAILTLLVLVPASCKSSRNAIHASTTAPTTSTTTTTTSTTLPPTTTTEPIIVEGGIVKVANASGVNGAARNLTRELTALGFTTRDGTNSAGIDEDLATSKIYVIAGSEPVAESISKLMGGVPVSRMPTPAWITGGTASLGDTTVLVMLGHDLAGTPLAEMGT
jgi:hypothetical protein